MTLEEAIKHAEKVATKMECEAMCVEEAYQTAKQADCEKCAAEHRQLAEWLTDYQRLLKAIDDIRAEIKTKYESIPGVPWRFKEYDDGWVMALEWTLEIIDKHIGKEGGSE